MRISPLLSLALACTVVAAQPFPGADAPEVDFKSAINLEGASKLGDLRGRLVLLDFFATW